MNIIIIVPCFNEFNRLPINEFIKHESTNSNVRFHFVNDGSTDDTTLLLKKLHKDLPSKFTFLDLEKNHGKAEAIRLGIQSVLNLEFDYIGYLDADLSSPLNELNNATDFLSNNKHKKIVFASRVKLMHNRVVRSTSRHFVGRVFSTAASILLKLKIYDTQCGFKIFSKELCLSFVNEKFISRWLFDIEIFLRIIKNYGKFNTIGFAYEMPVQTWVEKGNSKIKFSVV